MMLQAFEAKRLILKNCRIFKQKHLYSNQYS